MRRLDVTCPPKALNCSGLDSLQVPSLNPRQVVWAALMTEGVHHAVGSRTCQRTHGPFLRKNNNKSDASWKILVTVSTHAASDHVGLALLTSGALAHSRTARQLALHRQIILKNLGNVSEVRSCTR